MVPGRKSRGRFSNFNLVLSYFAIREGGFLKLSEIDHQMSTSTMVRKGGTERGRARGKAVYGPTRLQGKDSKLVALVREADREANGKEKESVFDPKKIGKKQIFRPILTSPFNARWPTTTSSVHLDVILHMLLELLENKTVVEILKRENSTTPRASSRKTKEKNKRRKQRMTVALLEQRGIIPCHSSNTVSNRTEASKSKKPSEEGIPFLFGLNSITRLMESCIRDKLKGNSTEKVSQPTLLHSPMIIFVCQFDVDPPTLVSHLPLLTATYNAILEREIHLIRLPLGAEAKISQATNLRRCSILSIDSTRLTEGSEAQGTVNDLLAKVKEFGIEDMRMEWMDKTVAALHGSGYSIPLLPAQVKHLRSSAPLDLNVVKTAKRKERTERKEQRKKRKLGKAENEEKQLRQSRKRRRTSS